MCELLANGNSAVSVAKQIDANTDLTVPQIKHFIGDSVSVYCPQYESELHD